MRVLARACANMCTCASGLLCVRAILHLPCALTPHLVRLVCSNKDRRRLKDLEESYAEEKAVQERVESGLANFSISHASGSGSTQTDNAADITIEGFSISAHKKDLFVNADLRIVHDRRYGLLGAWHACLMNILLGSNLRHVRAARYISAHSYCCFVLCFLLLRPRRGLRIFFSTFSYFALPRPLRIMWMYVCL